ncbi:MAG: hypothetical protein ACI8PT_004308 [Gammaproteobacteria bacterium]
MNSVKTVDNLGLAPALSFVVVTALAVELPASGSQRMLPLTGSVTASDSPHPSSQRIACKVLIRCYRDGRFSTKSIVTSGDATEPHEGQTQRYRGDPTLEGWKFYDQPTRVNGGLDYIYGQRVGTPEHLNGNSFPLTTPKKIIYQR